MTKVNLGAKLAETLATESAVVAEKAAEAAALQANSTMVELSVALRFFDDVVEYFTTEIIKGTPTSKLVVELNSRSAAYKLLADASGRDAPACTFPGHRFYPFWDDFRNWASESGLTLSWEYRWGNSGASLGYALRVRPSGVLLKNKD